ncbi:MAG: hypothetical protein A3C30_03320 [Candidatus Levybacteria bacterium RIFCSPHIGHO2_02_FULL_40_18]|nr:MAG: hypothetical protein A3C30_03320 [Candidatus Levybacteria bacterium RIFCSPHIGHO2_02_FULL_40_18]OGH49596.1 MAG: hypothetical protein A3I54_05105 [Candidatus Levybacteria bacterium RIFCSPLOWO2_02_FULL_41_11]OGH54005.1 MAG: hypothetical protein A3G15_01390 [Candidatus Levybacteria bacterium RIFCSPLOWO2_12_FULL_40_10]
MKDRKLGVIGLIAALLVAFGAFGLFGLKLGHDPPATTTMYAATDSVPDTLEAVPIAVGDVYDQAVVKTGGNTVVALMDSETTTAVILATSLLVLAAIGVLYIVAHDPTSSSRRLRLLRLNTMRRVLHGIGMSAFIGRSVITFSRPVLAIVAFISVIAISVLSLNTSTAFAGDAGLADAGNSSVLFGIAGAIAFAFALALAGVATLKFARR